MMAMSGFVYFGYHLQDRRRTLSRRHRDAVFLNRRVYPTDKICAMPAQRGLPGHAAEIHFTGV
jgi:hypothetical protein